MKKRGFGQGKWNGPGGKSVSDETPEQTCRREFFEETGSSILELEPRGTVEYVYADKPEWDQVCHIFVATSLEGEPQETEEILPRWFELNALPFDSMWADDPYWLPAVLMGGLASERFVFDKDGNISSHEKFDR